MSEGILRFTEVHKRLQGQQVLRGFSAEIPLDEVTYLVGRSGEGKSVTCRLAVGLLKPDRGQIELGGERVDRMPERALLRLRRKAPYVVQGPALLDWMSVRQNVALALGAPTTKGPSKEALERADAQLRRVGMAELGDRAPSEIGPGAQKRAAIARALMLEPSYLLFDEPTTGLDRRAAGQVNEVIRELKEEGLGALVVSHDYASLAQVADRVIMLGEGKVAFNFTPEAFFASQDPAVLGLRGG